jgi:TolA-binding protein
MTKHKHYDSAYRAYYAISFSPEKRAITECNFFDEINKEFTELGADERAFTKFESLFLASLNAKSNCMSSMITGSANFPVARMEKMNNRERAATQEMYDFIDKVRKAIDKVNNPSTDIRSDDKDAITKLKEKLANLEKNQEKMKACNKIIKDKKDNKIERLTEILGNEETAREVLKPSRYGIVGYESFSLTNNNATIRSTKKRIAQLEAQEGRKTTDLRKEELNLTITQNAENDRIQFFFDDKPEREVIDLMKRHGFKWSKNNNCWQRLWNNNCVYAVKNYILPKLQELN